LRAGGGCGCRWRVAVDVFLDGFVFGWFVGENFCGGVWRRVVRECCPKVNRNGIMFYFII